MNTPEKPVTKQQQVCAQYMYIRKRLSTPTTQDIHIYLRICKISCTHAFRDFIHLLCRVDSILLRFSFRVLREF